MNDTVALLSPHRLGKEENACSKTDPHEDSRRTHVHGILDTGGEDTSLRRSRGRQGSVSAVRGFTGSEDSSASRHEINCLGDRDV